MSDVKRVTLTTISDVVKKGGGGGASGGPAGNANVGGPFGARSFDTVNVMSSAFGGSSAAFGGGSPSSAGKETTGGSGNGPGAGSSTKKHKTVRLELNLFEPTTESFPEFNFSKLIHEEQKRLKKALKKQQDDAAADNNGFLSEPELDNDVARMARELERKYGSGTAYASKDKFARPAKLDYCDRGAGYDEEDSFIDNSEAYDELIPQEIETVGGGFYINSGQLEFKQLSNFERPDDVHRMPKPKKRALSTSSESSDEEDEAAKKKPDESGPQQVPQLQQQPAEKPTVNAEQQLQQQLTEDDKVSSAANSGTEMTHGDDKPRLNGHVAKKQKLLDPGQVLKGAGGDNKEKAKAITGGGAVTDGAKEKTNGVKAKVNPTTQPVPTVANVAVAGGKKDENENDGGVKLIKTTTVKDMLRAKRDSMRKMEQEKKGRSSGSSRVSSSEAEEDGDGGGDEDDEDEENDEDEDEDEEEDEEDDEMGDGSDKNSNESGSEDDIGSESESSHESAIEKDAVALAKATANGTDSEGQRPATVGSDPQQKERKRKDSKLPDDLPESLRNDVEALKELARSHSIGGKLNYFDSKVAELLVQIDDGARAAGTSIRNAVFRHLDAQLSISRQSLQLKLKKIRIRKLEARAKIVIDQLANTVCDVMPIHLAKHELNCRKVMEQRAAAQAAAAASTATGGTNVMSSTGGGPAMANGGKLDPPPHTTTSATPQIRNPKKKFTWSDRARDLLWELYNIRLQTYALVRPRNETEDDFVAEYLRIKVVVLWPKGWMRYEDLHKELDRRKKTLAKGQGTMAKKQPLAILSPLASPPPPGYDSTLLHNTPLLNGVKPDGRTVSAVAGGSLSPNGSHKRTSDHSIINIMNSPPLPPTPGEKQSTGNRSLPNARRSFDEDQLMLSPPNPAGTSSEKDNFNASKRVSGGTFGSSPELRQSLPAGDSAAAARQRWNSREDDSDSSIEIIGEYNASGGGHAPAAGVIHSGRSNPNTTPPGQTQAHLPVLNKEKYKNLISGKAKAHGGPGGGSGGAGGASPVGSTDSSPGGGVIAGTAGTGKYSKHHSPTSGGNIVTGTPPGVSLPFPSPSGARSPAGFIISDVRGAVGVGGSGSVRLKDSPPTMDLDVQQIMKDLKELQELQQHHNVGSSRKGDTPSIPAQQQHATEPTPDFFIDCDLDGDDFLFDTASYS